MSPSRIHMRRRSSRQQNKALFEGIGRGPVGSEAIRVRVRCFFLNGDEGHKIKRLHRPVEHGRNRQRPKLAVFLGNVDAAKQQGSVSPAFQHVDISGFLPQGFPANPVHSRGVFPLVGGDSLNGQGPCRQRRGRIRCNIFILPGFPSRNAFASRVTTAHFGVAVPSEPYLRISAHTARTLISPL